MEVLAVDPLQGSYFQVQVDPNGFRLEPSVQPSTPQTPWILSPGLFDLQVNGFAGIDLNQENLEPEQVLGLVQVLAKEGVGAFLPTLVTGSKERLLTAMQAIATACERWPLVAAAIPAIHLEGPYISPLDGARGAHPVQHVRPASLSEFAQLQAAAKGRIGLLTLAPEVEGALELTQVAHAAGVRVAIGHTLAPLDTIAAAVEAGATLSTHLGNGIPAQLPRHPNLIWEQLAQPGLWASLIVDTHHLSAKVAQSLIRAKGLEKVCLISDSVYLGGLPPGVYRTDLGGEVEVWPEGKAVMRGTPYLAGAVVSLRQVVQTAVTQCGLSLGDAFRLATHNPSRYMNKAYRSAVLWHWDGAELQAVATQIGGELVYIRSK